MIRRISTICAITAAVMLATTFARPAAAQTLADEAAQVRRVPRPPQRHLGLRAFAAFDADAMVASSTFDAVLGTHILSARGAGGELLNLWKGLFIRVAATRTTKTGSRVVVVDKEAVPLGIPLTVEMVPVEFGAGWRRGVGQRGQGGWYAGGGLVHLVYRETSKFAGVGENTNTTFNGAVVFAGADVRIWHFIVGGGEVQVRSIPNALGTGGASQAFSETNLGGVTARGLIGIRF
ncbi:MAG: hypothetical protein ABI634_18655 [Acidobacteriota bacterium]